MPTPQEWYNGLPIVSRIWLTAAVVSGLGTKLGLINPYLLIFSWEAVWHKFQIWRIITNFLFFGGPSFPWLIMMFMLAQYSPALESDPYPSGGGPHAGNTADFFWMLCIGGGILLAIGTFLGYPLLSFSLYFMVIYVWSKRNATRPAKFYFFPEFPAVYLPWVMVGFSFIVGDDPVRDLMGIAAGHLFYFLNEVLPDMDGPLKGIKLLKTPSFIYKLFNLSSTDNSAAFIRLQQRRAAQAAGTGINQAGAADQGARGHNWGNGHVLGRRD